MRQNQLSEVLLKDELNKAIYTQSHETEMTLEVQVKSGILKAEVSVLYPRIIAGRDVRVVTFRTLNGLEWIQPFYKSSGRATPDRSPAGTWWPFSAQYWEEALDAHFPGEDLPYGWIGKEYWLPREKRWVSHHKTTNSVPPQLMEIAKSFG